MPTRKRRVRTVLLGSALAGALTAAPTLGEQVGASGPDGPLEMTLAVHPAQVEIGDTVTASGVVRTPRGPAGGVALELRDASGGELAQTVTGPDGSFSFAPLAPERNTLLGVAPPRASAAGASVNVWVDPRVELSAHSLGPGRTRLSFRVAHTPQAHPRTEGARWYVASGRSRRFAPIALTPLRAVSASVARADALIDPPARRFSWRVCINPPWEAVMGPPAAHGPCPDHAFTLPAPTPSALSAGDRHTQASRPARGGAAQTAHTARGGAAQTAHTARGGAAQTAHTARGGAAHAAFMFGGEGRGVPLPPFPSPAAISAAERWLNGRAGATAMAVVDSAGRLSGLRSRSHFETASVVKVMFMAAYLQRLQSAHRALAAADRALLYPMIHESNNDSASAVLGIVGEGAVERIARETAMRDYAPGVGWWAFSQTSAADQAQLMWKLGAVMPPRYYPYARYLMSTIEPEQSWGFPPVARPGWRVYFKTGALPSRGLFNEVARLERGGIAFSVAVLSDHEPSQAYGEETIAGAARALLGG